MLDALLLRDLGLILVTAAAFALAAQPLRVPAIIAYIIAGLVLGPLTGAVEVTPTLGLTSQLGIALLLFLVGLELSFEQIKGVGTVAVAAGLGQVAFTVSLGFVLASLLGFEAVESAFIATALTFSSTVIPVKLLGGKRELDTLYGRVAVGVFMVQNLVVIVFLTLLAGLGQEGVEDFGSVAIGMVKAFAGMAVLLAAALVASRYLLARVFAWIASSLEALFVWSLTWCFLFVMGAEAMGLSLEIGAFLAGISLAQLPYSGELRRRVHPLVSFFIAIFFVTLGIQMDLTGGLSLLLPASTLSLFILIGNPLSILLVVTFMRYGIRTGFLAGVTVAQISEFSFIFAAAGIGTGLVGPEILPLVTVVGLVTMAVSAYMIVYNHQLYELARRWRLLAFLDVLDRRPPDLDDRATETAAGEALGDHVIVVGMNALGKRIVEGLRERGMVTLAVDSDPTKLSAVAEPRLVGNTDDLSVLETAGLARARLLVSALQIEDANTLLAHRCRTFGVPCSIHAFDVAVVPDLRETGATHLIDSKTAGTRQLSEALRAEGVYG